MWRAFCDHLRGVEVRGRDGKVRSKWELYWENDGRAVWDIATKSHPAYTFKNKEGWTNGVQIPVWEE